jgi:hypothetical protein
MRRLVVLVAAGAAAAFVCASAHAETVWLCYPGKKPDPCTRSLDFTAGRGDGSAKVYRVGTNRRQPVDCFYVYPTVSLQRTPNSNLKIELEETDVAQLQASWFSPICRVFAPMYRQITAYRNAKSSSDLAYSDVRAAWRDYVAHDNHGRGVVLIGHSQGSFMLTRLIRDEFDDAPKVRKLLVSAILLGGNVLVGNGSPRDGDFQHVPPCASMTQVGCVVAFSTFAKTPPRDASFESVRDPARQHVLCVNPAAPGGGAAPVTPLFLTTSFSEMGGVSPALMFAIETDWVSYPNLYEARCVRQGSRAWLQVTAVSKGDKRPTAKEQNGPGWGLHNLDVNIALFELVGLVGSQTKAYCAANRC